VFERFTDRARRVVVLAQEEARLLEHNYIGTEHLLLGLIREGEGVAARALDALDVELDQARGDVLEIIGRGEVTPAGHIPFTPRSKKVLELSLKEATSLRVKYIGTEHILLGLLREGEGVAAQILHRRGVTLEVVRQEVIALLAIDESAVAAVGDSGVRPADRPAWRVERVPPTTQLRRASDEAERPPMCPRCDADLSESARYAVHDVPRGNRETQDDAEERNLEPGPTRRAAFLYCGECGRVVASNLLEPDAGS
jgi:ATP-dependent Clp protease ATP-binding subunit ClpA